MKICVVLPSLGGGGAERLHINLIENWLKNDHIVELIVLTGSHEASSINELVPKECKTIFLKSTRIRNSIFSLVRHLRINNYDVILAAMWPLTILVILASKLSFSRAKIFVSEHTVLSISRSSELKVSERFIRITSAIFYRLTNGIIAVSKGVQEDLSKLTGLNKTKIKVIYNPAALQIARPSEQEIIELRNSLWNKNSRIRILGVGTLKVQKGFDVLIDAINHLPNDLRERCHLIILGEGPERNKLEKKINTLDISSNITLPGFQIDPYPWFFSADIFVLSSRWEGFGNVIVEAMEAGLRIVSTDCKSGPAEILNDGKFGELVKINDPAALSNSIIKSLNKQHNPSLLRDRAMDFSVEKISKEYLNFFKDS